MDGVLGLDYDWYPGSVPPNVKLGRDVYIDTTYAFAAFHSKVENAMVLGDRSGAYSRSSFIVGPAGKIVIGNSTIVNAAYIVCEDRVEVGSHCLLAWGAFITDSWPESGMTPGERSAAVVASARDPRRTFPRVGGRPVRIEDNVWVGFGSVIMPGVTLGRGCVIGSRTVISVDIPPYAVAVGDPVRIVRYLEPTDSAP